MNNNINEIDLKIKKNLNQEDLYFYLFDVSYVLEEYRKMMKTPLKISFTGKQQNNNQKIEDLANKYLTLAQKYSNDVLTIPKNKKKSNVVCPTCQNNIFDIVDNLYTCLECGTEIRIGLLTSVSDISCVNIHNKQLYDRVDTFNVVMETFPFSRDFDLITLLLKDFKLLEKVFSKTYFNKNMPYMPFVLYKLLQKHNYIFTEEIEKKITNKKSIVLNTCFDILKWPY